MLYEHSSIQQRTLGKQEDLPGRTEVQSSGMVVAMLVGSSRHAGKIASTRPNFEVSDQHKIV